jgi:outer membrane lipoprotein-sorting protein
MRGKVPFLLGSLLSTHLAHAAAAQLPPAAPQLSVTQIVDKHVAARGGLTAWRAVQTLSVTGKMDVGSGDSLARSLRASGFGGVSRRGAGAAAARDKGADQGAAQSAAEPQVQVPFRLEMKRPRKSRVEIDFAGSTAVQVYDGTNGWKLRPFLNRNDVESFTAEEAKASNALGDMEGPLIDYAAKGTQVALEGVEAVGGRNAYKLKLTLKEGTTRQIWVDAQSFLDVKIEGAPRRMDGRMHNVYVYQTDFRSTQGIRLPFAYDTTVEGYPQSHRMTIQTAAVNPKLDDSRFEKPQPAAAPSPAHALPAASAAPAAASHPPGTNK